MRYNFNPTKEQEIKYLFSRIKMEGIHRRLKENKLNKSNLDLIEYLKKCKRL